jgi:hypothetical protein
MYIISKPIFEIREMIAKSEHPICLLMPLLIFGFIATCQIVFCFILSLLSLLDIVNRSWMPITLLLAIGGGVWFSSAFASFRRIRHHLLRKEQNRKQKGS